MPCCYGSSGRGLVSTADRETCAPQFRIRCPSWWWATSVWPVDGQACCQTPTRRPSMWHQRARHGGRLKPWRPPCSAAAANKPGPGLVDGAERAANEDLAGRPAGSRTGAWKAAAQQLPYDF